VKKQVEQTNDIMIQYATMGSIAVAAFMVASPFVSSALSAAASIASFLVHGQL
jgi:hypothetical protein